MDPVKMGVLLIVILLSAIAIIPMVSADKLIKSDETGVDGKNIILNITFPKEGSIIHGDVIGFPTTIYADVDSPNGIKEVWITNGINQSLCWAAIGHGFVCQNPWQTGWNTIKITAYDNSGNAVSQTRNYSLVIGQNPPTTMSTTPQNTSLSGFGFPLGICAVFIILLMISTMKKR